MRAIRRSFLVVGTLSAIFARSTATVAADWTPPKNPDPQSILNEANADALAGRYEQALAKRVWFHEHAIEYRPSMSGVRLSFALSDWRKLGDTYPPALTKLREVRDETLKRVTDDDAKQVKFKDFQDLASLNRTLDEEAITVKAFQRLDAADAKIATRVFLVSQPALIKAKEYELCAKYIDSDESVKRIMEAYKRNQEFAKNPRYGQLHKDYMVKKFFNEAATLVALLVIDHRREEAEDAAHALKEAEGDATFHATLAADLDKALKGVVPDPWP